MSVTGLELRKLRTDARIPQEVIATILGFPRTLLGRIERGEDPLTDQIATAYVDAVGKCTRGEVCFDKAKYRVEIPRTKGSGNLVREQEITDLREKILAANVSRTQLAYYAGVSVGSVGNIIMCKSVTRPIYNRIRTGLATILRERMEAEHNATLQAAPVIPAEIDNSDEPDEPAKCERVDAADYIVCSEKDTLFLRQAVLHFEIPRDKLASYLGVPLAILNAKLDGFMPIYQPEFVAVLSFIRKPTPTIASSSRQQYIHFPGE